MKRYVISFVYTKPKFVGCKVANMIFCVTADSVEGAVEKAREEKSVQKLIECGYVCVATNSIEV
jgi:hypothetical protein